ncbi:hypothetical protein HU764_003300 [Pseudomonas sp. SWRI100]|uniref:hypothetical protein n=2 Tax=Pseudomonas TaxID=286 RepID=UPI001647ED5E|nr:hypothetical protein [Pseudomonas sp. SWRI50]MBC3484240.1 hypothetical protein [Pseudomonas sp. SWRI50]MBC3497520.1 hypothetical protein [Pseudomonas sp. SWRI67]MBV4525125.1 hypothetical protein [Pseudomonas kermanshahensis]
MTAISFRPAVPEDAAACMTLRALTQENAFTEEDLRALGITVDSWSSGIRDGSGPGFVAWTSTGEHDEAGDEILQLRVDRRAR